MQEYDLAYQDWLRAKVRQDYPEADRIREDFERIHGLTIFLAGEMPVEGITIRRMLARDWHSKYGSKAVAKALADRDSAIAAIVPDYKGLLIGSLPECRRNTNHVSHAYPALR